MWNFRVIDTGFPERNPRETEFFKLRSFSEAVAREFIQNSLDARISNENVKIKISLITCKKKEVGLFLDNDLKQHLVACDLLPGSEYPEDIRCLILEDYGTTGLDGSYLPDAGNGNFYDFWWREGISEKTSQKAGRWGLGKITFNMVSKIRTFFGLTVRNDGKILLMGKALLKTHKLNNQRYHYFGYFSGNNFMPLENEKNISQFKKIFGVNRNNADTGLSLVIPVLVDEINFDYMLKSVIQHYFYAIFTGKLEIEMYDGIDRESLNGNNLFEKVSIINWNGTDWEGINIKEILEFLKTATGKPAVNLKIKNFDNPQITSQSFEEQFDRIKESFISGDCINLKVPVIIRKIGDDQHETFFTVMLKKFPDLKKSFEAYIRSGILISEIESLGNRSVAAFFIAEDSFICEFLGDCETPAHTNWNEKTEGFENKYKDAKKKLRFIRKSIIQIVNILDEPPRERQVDFLKEIFSIPLSHEEKDKEKNTTKQPGIPNSIKIKPVLFNIFRIRNGFNVALNPGTVETISFPLRVTIKMAYDTFRGNPFKQYEEFDFDVSNTLNISSQDCNILKKIKNVIEIEVTGKKFKIEVTGFDSNRDLAVNIRKEVNSEA